MRSHFLAVTLASACILATVACSSTGQQDWSTYLDAGAAAYKVYCITNPGSDYCTAEAAQKAVDAYKAAQKAIAAYNAGTGDLAAVEKAVKAAFKLFADFKG